RYLERSRVRSKKRYEEIKEDPELLAERRKYMREKYKEEKLKKAELEKMYGVAKETLAEPEKFEAELATPKFKQILRQEGVEYLDKDKNEI
ncbi:hypothetical protein B6U93_04060, partial [Candidatus Woesearchaeota archaeon ex4484_78]